MERMDVLVVREDEKKGKTYWTKIGAAFPSKDGWEAGFTLALDALPLTGRLVCRPPKPREDGGGF